MDKQSLSNGFRRIKLDFTFTLSGGESIKKDFTYDRQRNYYIKEIFGDTINMTAIIDYGKQYKLASEYMFPNSPEKIKSKRFLVEMFASCVLLARMNGINSYTTAIDEYQMRYACLQGYEFSDGDVEDLFIRKIRNLHIEYTQQFTKSEYDDFRALMTKYADRFNPILQAFENTILNKSETRAKDLVGFDRLKADLTFVLAAGNAVQKNITYDAQVEHYIKSAYGNLSAAEAIIAYGKEHQKISQYMFPNSPEKIQRRKILFQVFAECTLMQQIYLANSYADVMNESNMRHTCIDSQEISDVDMKNVFSNEIGNLYGLYTQTFTEKNLDSFKKLMKNFATQFNVVFESIKNRALNKSDNRNATKQQNNDPHEPFVKLCDRWGVSRKIRVSFKLKMDAFLETQIGINTEYVDYIDNLQHTWQNDFPKYQYCDQLVEYVRQYKKVCIIAYGNKISTISDEKLLIELLVSVNLKLAIANGGNNVEALDEYLNRVAASLPRENLRDIFNDSVPKVKTYYFPENFRNYGEEINAAVLPYKDGLEYINDILMEEINFRFGAEVVETPQPSEQIEIESSDTETTEQVTPNYEEIIAQKDAEILSLQNDLEYYENLDQRNFRNDILQYDKGLTDVIKKLCERKFGSPLNELYLMSAGKKDITPDNVKAVMQNFLFILNSLGVNPYDNMKIGKTVKFDSEEANIVYTVDETKLVDGINKGVLKYPGWKYKGEEMVLPVIEVE